MYPPVMPDSTPRADRPGVVIFPPLLFVSCLLTGQLLHWLWPVPAFIPWLPRVVLAGLALVVAAVFGIGGARAEWRRYQRQSAPSPTRHACAAGCRRA